MKLFIFFGLPGAGKTYVGKVVEKYFDFYLYDGDQDMSDAYKKAVMEETMTDDLRQDFFDHLIESIGELKEEKIVVTQTFIKEKFRKQLLNTFPEAKFILVDASTEVREKRLQNMGRFELSFEKWQRMSKIFEEPQIPYQVIHNDRNGEDEIKKQLEKIFV
jgi:gluconate kinase